MTHFPYLLSLTDAHGFSALHHAEMSGNPCFVAQVLELYRDPKTFALKVLTYESEEELLEDRRLGVELASSFRAFVEPSEALPAVLSVGKGSLAEAAGVMAGDVLEAVRGATFLSQRNTPPLEGDVLGALCIGGSDCLGFPVVLEFRGSACAQILCRDGWTPSHGAAGKAGNAGHRQILDQLLTEKSQAQFQEDAVGYTPVHWLAMEAKATGGPRRRPLSADSRGASRVRCLQEGRPVSARSQPSTEPVAPADRLVGGQAPQVPRGVPCVSAPLPEPDSTDAAAEAA